MEQGDNSEAEIQTLEEEDDSEDTLSYNSDAFAELIDNDIVNMAVIHSLVITKVNTMVAHSLVLNGSVAA